MADLIKTFLSWLFVGIVAGVGVCAGYKGAEALIAKAERQRAASSKCKGTTPDVDNMKNVTPGASSAT